MHLTTLTLHYGGVHQKSHLFFRYTTCDEMIKRAEVKNCGSRHAKGDKRC